MNITTAENIIQTHRELLEIIKMELKMEKKIFSNHKKTKKKNKTVAHKQSWFDFAFKLKARIEMSQKTAIEQVFVL